MAKRLYGSKHWLLVIWLIVCAIHYSSCTSIHSGPYYLNSHINLEAPNIVRIMTDSEANKWNFLVRGTRSLVQCNLITQIDSLSALVHRHGFIDLISGSKNKGNRESYGQDYNYRRFQCDTIDTTYYLLCIGTDSAEVIVGAIEIFPCKDGYVDISIIDLMIQYNRTCIGEENKDRRLHIDYAVYGFKGTYPINYGLLAL